jgi:hypothetical protein
LSSYFSFDSRAFPFSFSFSSFSFHKYWVLNSGLHTCKAITLPLEPHHQTFLLWLFGDSALIFAHANLDCNPSIFMLLYISGITGMLHYTQNFFIEMSFTIVLPSWPGTMILLISTSQVARIAGVNHCHPI